MFVCANNNEKGGDNQIAELLKNFEKNVVNSCCLPCPPEDTKLSPDPPELMVCYKTESKKSGRTSKRSLRKKRDKSRELRGGILYMGCDCEKRNGLQDDCRRTACQGAPECLTKPEPICGPSEFAGGKHLGRRNYFDGAEVPEGDGRINATYTCFPAMLTVQ